jgi:high-affinity iron transporter
MLAAAIIVFREVIEAGLIVGIVLAFTRSAPGSRLWIAGGVLGGVIGSCLVAAFTGGLASLFAGAGQELFNAVILALAVVMLTWHNVWMARHGREMAADLRAAGEAVSHGSKSLAALAVVVGVAVLREGAEVVLFLYGIGVSDNASWALLLAGGLAGLAAGALLSGLAYFGLLKIPARRLFLVTSTLIAFLAAGMAAQSAAFLEQAGIVDVLSENAWSTGDILSDKSILGRVLHTLIGYSDQPSVLQLIVYVLTLGVIFVLMRLIGPRSVERNSGRRMAQLPGHGVGRPGSDPGAGARSV